MNVKSIIASVGIVAALVLGVSANLDSNQVIVTEPAPVIGASGSGQDTDSHQYFNGGVTSGGRVATTSTAGTYTLSTIDVASTPTYIDWLPNLNITLSLSASSTRAYVPNIGDVAKVYIRNASSTATATITLAAVDAGVDLQKNEDTADLAIAGLDFAELTLIRESTNLVTVLFAEFTEAD